MRSLLNICSFRHFAIFETVWDCSGEGLLGHDIVEVIHAHGAVAVGVSAVDHLLQLFVSHGLAELFSDAAEVTERDGAAGVVVEQSEDFANVLPRVFVAHAGGHHVEELLKVDGTGLVLVEVGDHLEDRLVLGFEAQGLHGCTELLGVNVSGAVRVEEIEGFFDLLDLIFGESGSFEFLGVELGLGCHGEV